MRLSEFILQNMQAIIARWEEFAAAQLPSAVKLKPLELRDHVQEILIAISEDIARPPTRKAQTENPRGDAIEMVAASTIAARKHATQRAQSGYDINQLTAEYRALRASIIRLWTDAYSPDRDHIEDLIRFNEAVDRALSESVCFFSARVDASRNLLLGMLGHDIRSPLQTIQMSSAYLMALNADVRVSETATRITNSCARMKALLDDLLDFNRVNLGLGIEIHPSDVDMSSMFIEELDQLRTANPAYTISLEESGNTHGLWDGMRLRQVLANLVLNALKYGTPVSEVRVVLTGDDKELRFDVCNSGPAIEESTLKWIFDPLKRGEGKDRTYDSGGNLGLGLYIARAIAKSHGGDIEARSDQTETVFSVRLPRRQ